MPERSLMPSEHAAKPPNFSLFCKTFMKICQIISRILCIRLSANNDNSTFPGNKITNSCSRYENCELYTQQVLKFYLYSVSLSFVNLEVTTVEQWQLQFIFFEVTWQQASKHYKQINNGCTFGHVSVVLNSCTRWGRSERQVLKLLLQALWDVALCQLVKGDFPQNNIAYIFRIEHWKEIWLFSKCYYLFREPLVVVQFTPYNKTKRTFKFWISC